MAQEVREQGADLNTRLAAVWSEKVELTKEDPGILSGTYASTSGSPYWITSTTEVASGMNPVLMSIIDGGGPPLVRTPDLCAALVEKGIEFNEDLRKVREIERRNHARSWDLVEFEEIAMGYAELVEKWRAQGIPKTCGECPVCKAHAVAEVERRRANREFIEEAPLASDLGKFADAYWQLEQAKIERDANLRKVFGG